ncbi:hypothetical protein C2G38_2202093 [Gigaspora rosea]|uniref:Uncharacterized protein n=1 Tax=Gigaspora rosea TaxID=44941 RepID=A0A397URU3_9GLOM|nr:hypothetical protein C2G38_2202093 [Gigaspora rosea]
MTRVLYEKQRIEHNTLELTPDHFQTILEDAEPQLVGFFDELYNAFIPERRSAFNRKEDKKKVVNICYSIAAIRNRLVNNYPLEIGLYLVASGASCDAINALHNAGITINSFFVYNIDDYHNIHGIRRPDTLVLSAPIHFSTCVSKEITKCEQFQ